MTTITFILRDGRRQTVSGQSGSIMEVARGASVPGIIGECGGSCSCGTCHVQLSEEGLAILGPASEAEGNILEFEDTAGPASRLSCQITLSERCEGLVFTIPGGTS